MYQTGPGQRLATALLLTSLFGAGSAAEEPAPSAVHSGEAALSGAATSEEIASLIRDLGDASYDRRTRATRRLTAIGRAAGDALKSAAEGAEFETARRARSILHELDNQWMLGLDVTVSVSRSSIAWDESIDLLITFHNPTRYPSRVPFDLTGGTVDANRLSHAEQVGRMLDAVDFLTVRRQGTTIDPRVDDIAADEDVQAAVERRVTGGPSAELAPGGRVSITVPAFNRGWARYPLLDSGEYEIIFEHQPAWGDEVLTQQRVGLVRSPSARLHVTAGAPDVVSRAGVEAFVELTRSEDVLVARLTNTSDLPTTVNLNFGSSAPFAQARWIVFRGETYGEIAVRGAGQVSLKDFDASLLKTVAPGESVELARVDVASLQAPAADGVAGACLVHLHYQNLLDRRWQSRQRGQVDVERTWPEALRGELPQRILTGTQSSDRVELVLP